MAYRYRRNNDRTIEGFKVDRSRREYPYSYTRFCMYKNKWKESDFFIYTDRLHVWNENYDELKEKYLGKGDYFSSYDPEAIENFLCKFMNKKVMLTGMEEECNFGNGYPYWILYYREVN